MSAPLNITSHIQEIALYVFMAILVLGLLGVLSHITRKHPRVEWALRVFIVGISAWDASLFLKSLNLSDNFFISISYAASTLISLLSLFMPFRQFISRAFTILQLSLTGQILLLLVRKKLNALAYFDQKRIFIPNSFPHLMALFIYGNVVAYFLTNWKLGTNLTVFPLPTSQDIQQFLPYSGIAFILLSLCGIGLYITRSFKAALQRLSLFAPNKWQVGLGILLIFASFTYEAYWTIYTHSLGQDDLATRLSYYNASTLTSAGAFFPSVILALLMALCVAVGEEVLFRGALQPVFGILPAAFLHGLLVSHNNPKPMLILQITAWSVCLGLVKRYTNTTTTIIAHAGFNLLTIILFIANP